MHPHDRRHRSVLSPEPTPEPPPLWAKIVAGILLTPVGIVLALVVAKVLRVVVSWALG